MLHVVGVLQHWGRDVKPGRDVPLGVESDLVIFRKFTVRIRPFWMLFTLFINKGEAPSASLEARHFSLRVCESLKVFSFGTRGP